MAFDIRNKFKSNKKSDNTEEENLVALIKSKYNEAYSAKGKLHDDWRKYEKAYDGEYFIRNTPDYRANEVSNFVFSTIETMKPIMLSNYPKLNVVPKAPESFYKSQLVQNALDYEWKREDMFTKLVESAHSSLVYGTSIFGLFWNGSTNGGLGDVNCRVISPFNFFPSPSATCIEDADYVIYATYKSVGELSNAYPEKAEELKVNTTSSPDTNLLNSESSFHGNNNIMYIECYFRDYSVETEIEDELDEDNNPTGNKVETKKRKYPNGRRVIIGGDVLLYDGENPYETGDFPFRVFKCYPQPNKFWGVGEIQNIISPQKYRTDVMNSIIENAGMMGNPVWIMDKNCGVEKNSLTNRRGLVVRKNPGTEVRRETPPAIPAYIKDIVNTLDADMEKISGVYDVLRGDKPVGVTAASAITALNEQAQGRIKLKVQTMESVIASLGGLWLSYMQQFWVTTRTVRVMGGNYEENELQDNMMMEQQEQQNVFNFNGKELSFQDVTKDDLDGDFDIEITAGSTMQQNKNARLQQLISLAQTPAEDGLPMIDRKTLLENSGIDNIMDVIRHFETKAQQQEQMQMQQQEQQAQLSQQQQQMKQEEKAMELQMKQENEMQKLQMTQEFNMQNKQVDKELDTQSKVEDLMLQPQAQEEGEEPNKETTSNTENVQEEGIDEEGREMLMAIVEQLKQMSPEEVEELAQREPKVAQLLQILSELQ